MPFGFDAVFIHSDFSISGKLSIVVAVEPLAVYRRLGNEMGHESQNFFLNGPEGRLEAIFWKPEGNVAPPMAAVVCHPHPLFGGTMHNKVAYQAAKSLDSLGLAVLRFNFRGTGMSAGTHDRGRGERGDVTAAVDFLATEFPGIPLLVAGFSFGCFVGLRVGCKDSVSRSASGSARL